MSLGSSGSYVFFVKALNNMLLNLCPTLGKNNFLLPTVPAISMWISTLLRLLLLKKPWIIATQESDFVCCCQEHTPLRRLVDLVLERDLSVHFVFTCPASASEFEAAAWLYNLLQDRVQHVGFLQNLGLTFCPKRNQDKVLIACQVVPYAEHCSTTWTHVSKTLEYVFPRQVVQECDTISALQDLSVVNSIDFRRQNGCHRISDKIDVTSLSVQLSDIETVENIVQPTIDAAWTHGLAECQVKSLFPWSSAKFQEHCPHGITMSVLDLKNFSDIKLKKILAQLAILKIRYHFLAYKRLAIVGPAELVINLHIALLPVDVHLPIGSKQGAFSIHMMRVSLKDTAPPADGHCFQAKFGKIGTFPYVPVQSLWKEIHHSICNENQIVQSILADHLHQNFGAVSFSSHLCQVNESQIKCLCFDIEVMHESNVPFVTHCGTLQLTVQHQCPVADPFRAELPLVENETRRDHWNKVIAEQIWSPLGGESATYQLLKTKNWRHEDIMNSALLQLTLVKIVLM